ncbi:hypothetical protein E6C60_1575 [Paenibacillus algicola]|uniref:Uncharacterized protein n=1 Tax=Paenibacillus algicola TaxID=2565926 RepID=A0A4P8XLD6_9BACL|nr:hypothetical protein E6C60_1575 [Paenibacillus algicola]
MRHHVSGGFIDLHLVVPRIKDEEFRAFIDSEFLDQTGSHFPVVHMCGRDFES